MLNAFIYCRIVTDEGGKPVDWVFLDVNDSFAKMSGLKKEDIIGKKATQLLPGELNDPSDWINKYGNVALSGEPARFESYRQSIAKWLDVSVYSPKKGFFVSMLDDITKRKKAEKEVQSLARFPLENPSIVFRISNDGKILYANPVSQQMADQMNTQAGETAPGKWINHIRQSLLTNSQIEFEEKHHEQIILFKVVPIASEGYANIYGNDITGRKQAETFLRESEQRWATTLASIGDAVIATEVSGKVVFMNGVAEELTGWTLSESSMKPVREVFNIINEQTRAKVEDPVSKVLEKGVIVGLANHTVLLRKDGSEIPIDDSGAPIKDKDGKTTGVVLIFRDITERKKNEERLNQLALMIENANDAIIGYDLDQRVTFWNKAAEKMYGYTTEEAGGKNSAELLNPSYVNAKREDLVDKLLTTGHLETESVRSTKDGRKLNVEAHVTLLHNETDKPIGFVSADRDITLRRQMQEKLTEYSRNLEVLVEDRTKKLKLAASYSRSLLEASLDPLVTINTEGKITDVNNATEQATGCSREELIGSDFSDYFTEPEKARIGYKRVFTKGFVIDYPLAIRHKSGKITNVLYNASVYRNEEGEVQGVFAAARDITQLKKAEEQYRTLFDSIDEGFGIIEMIFDANGKPSDYRFLEVNASFERQTGMHNAKGKLMRSFAPNHEEYWFETYGKVALTGEPVRFTNEAKALNRWYDVFAFPVGEEKIRKVGILFNDISQRVNLEKQLKDTERLAAIGATAGMVGHDIRNPLQAITSDVFLAKSDLSSIPESEEKRNVQESLGEIEKNVYYINKIVADLQDYARPLTPKIEEIDLEQTVHLVLAHLNIPGNITIKHSIKRGFPKLKTDQSYLQRILTNLANNAIQAMSNGGKLTITASSKNGKTLINVEDTGEGIPENVRSKMFLPLVTTKSKGQGFGLAVVKKFTEGLGGTVTFESEIGKGTKFTIELPT